MATSPPGFYSTGSPQCEEGGSTFRKPLRGFSQTEAWRDGSAVRREHCCYRGSEFSSQVSQTERRLQATQTQRKVSQCARDAVWLMDTGMCLSCLHSWRLSSDSIVSQVRKEVPGSEFIFFFLLGQNQPQSHKCDTRGWVAESLSSIGRWQKSQFLTLQRGTVPALRDTTSVV